MVTKPILEKNIGINNFKNPLIDCSNMQSDYEDVISSIPEKHSVTPIVC